MNKKMMYFYIDIKIKQKIERSARKNGISTSSLINVVLADYATELEIKETESRKAKKWVADLWNKVQEVHKRHIREKTSEMNYFKEVDKIFKEATE